MGVHGRGPARRRHVHATHREGPVREREMDLAQAEVTPLASLDPLVDERDRAVEAAPEVA